MVKVSDPVQKGMLTFEKFVILMEEDLRTKQIQGHMLYDFFLISLVLYLKVRLGLHIGSFELSSIQEPRTYPSGAPVPNPNIILG
jgi:hypothetical protein